MSESSQPSLNPPPAGQPQGADAALVPNVQLEKVYVKDLSLEIPHAPQIFAEQVQPQLEMQIGTQAAKLTERHYEVSVTATITARSGERTVFLVEVAQAGIFVLANIPQADIEPVLGISCPSILYPYLRETVSDTVTRAGFPAVLLSHMAFEGLYMQRVQQQAAVQQELAP